MQSESDTLAESYGVRFIAPEEQTILSARADDLYFYTVYAGRHRIVVERGDCIFLLADDLTEAILRRGPVEIESCHLAVVIRGYMPEDKTCGLKTRATLPYVNGCATRQLFPPERPGDPTLQWLDMPPWSAEQAHHIHSTVRVVYVLSGRGLSVVGMEQQSLTTELYPGQIVVLEKMCPHHFETREQRLIVIPLHIFSSVGTLEQLHPMFQGTHFTGS